MVMITLNARDIYGMQGEAWLMLNATKTGVLRERLLKRTFNTKQNVFVTMMG